MHGTDLLVDSGLCIAQPLLDSIEVDAGSCHEECLHICFQGIVHALHVPHLATTMQEVVSAIHSIPQGSTV